MAEDPKRQITQRRCKTSALTPEFFRNERLKYCTHCWYCGQLLYQYFGIDPRTKHDSSTKDHLVPRSKGGRGAKNLVPACHSCNVTKDNRTLEEFRLERFGIQGGLFWAEKHELNYRRV